MKLRLKIGALIICLSLLLSSVVFADVGWRGNHYWASHLNSTSSCSSGSFMDGLSRGVSNINGANVGVSNQVTAGLDLWKNGIFVDGHSVTKNGTGEVDAYDKLDACFHPATEDYELVTWQNYWFPDSAYASENAYLEQTYNW